MRRWREHHPLPTCSRATLTYCGWPRNTKRNRLARPSVSKWNVTHADDSLEGRNPMKITSAPMIGTDDTPIGYRLLRALALELQAVSATFDPKAQDAGRIAVLRSLEAISEFLVLTIGHYPRALVPFFELQYALLSLEYGSVDPLLAPKKVPHRPPTAPKDQALRAYASVVMELHMRAGLPRKQAASKVARMLSQGGHLTPQGKTITGRIVAKWRDKMKEGPANEDEVPAHQRFKRVLANEKGLVPTGPAAAALLLLKPASPRRRIPKKPPS
jgi:hypothetical protein